jgi:plasmid rolling circle replication initiator protein Rep
MATIPYVESKSPTKPYQKFIQDYPKHRWLFLTLTVKNCSIQELRKNLDCMNKSFIRLSKLKEFPGVGWIKSVEVTRGRDGNAHPHIHCLLMVAPGYFGANYLSQERWIDLVAAVCSVGLQANYSCEGESQSIAIQCRLFLKF